MFAAAHLTPVHSGSWVVGRVASSATPVLLLTGSAYGRKDAAIFNHSSASLYISPDQHVSTGSFALKLTSGSYYELPKPIYTDKVWGVWDGVNGFAMVSEKNSTE